MTTRSLPHIPNLAERFAALAVEAEGLRAKLESAAQLAADAAGLPVMLREPLPAELLPRLAAEVVVLRRDLAVAHARGTADTTRVLEARDIIRELTAGLTGEEGDAEWAALQIRVRCFLQDTDLERAGEGGSG